MKQHSHIHKFLSAGAFLLASSLLLSSCIKNTRPGETQFNNLQAMVLIPEGGMGQFGAAALVYPGSDASDTAIFHLNYAATNVAPADMTITIGFDQAALDAYNAQGGAQYAKFPDSIYSFSTTTVTVKKGNNYSDAINMVVFPTKIDPTKNYMYPISIKSAPNGAGISSNFGTIYYHLIGNPIAGSYSWNYTRWNNTDTTGPIHSSSFTGTPTLFSPDSPTQIEVKSGYYNGSRYVLSFDNNAGVLSNFQLSLNPDDLKAWVSPGISLAGGPTIVVADVSHAPHFYFEFTYAVSSGGAPRIFTDTYYK